MLISFILVKTTESCTNNTFKSTFIWDQGYRHESQELITWSRCGLLRAQFSDRLSQLLQWASYVQYVHKQRYAHRIVDGASELTFREVLISLTSNSSVCPETVQLRDNHLSYHNYSVPTSPPPTNSLSHILSLFFPSSCRCQKIEICVQSMLLVWRATNIHCTYCKSLGIYPKLPGVWNFTQSPQVAWGTRLHLEWLGALS